MIERTDVAIVGGGISGLATAWDLAREGVPFRLLESSDRWGGRIVTERASGFLVEGGPDSLFAQKPAALALCRDLGLGDRLVPAREPRTVYVVKRGRLHPLPPGLAAGAPSDVRAFLRSRLFSWAAKARMALEPAVPRRRDGAEESIAGFFRRRLGAEALALVGDPLLAGIHAGDPELLSLQATMPRLAEVEQRAGSLARGMRPAAASGPPPPMFYALAGGLGELVDALVRALPAGSFRTHAAVAHVVRSGGVFDVALADGSIVRARDLVMALPAPAASRVLASLDMDLAAWLIDIPFASTATVALGYRREDVGHPLDGHGLLVPRREGLRTTACSFVSSKYSHRAPEGHVLLRAFVGGVRDPEAHALGPDELVALVERELTPLLDLRGRPCLAQVQSWHEAMPQMQLGHAELMVALDRQVAQFPGLAVIGAGLRGTGIGDAVAEGLATAQGIVRRADVRTA